MDHDHTGQLIFCGDAQVSLIVSILSFNYLSNSELFSQKQPNFL